MIQYTIKRIVSLVPVLLGVTLITFILMYIVPGDPVLSMVGERSDQATIDRLRAELHLNDPLYLQYAKYMGNVLQGNLGRSFINQRPVSESIMETFPKTLRLAFSAMLLATLFGVVMGIISAVRPHTFWDRFLMLLTLGGISVPVFWLALILIWVVAVYLQWLPPSGYGGGNIKYLVLPALALGTQSAAFIARITRAYMLEILSQTFIVTARAKGVHRFWVINKHALRNVLIPVITIIGTEFGNYLSGSVLTESIFGWPGLGRFTLEAILKRDFPVIQGAVLYMAIVFVLVNLAVDLLYGYLDPRVSMNKE
jgi:ABC-type dipeptide/oligopeptide/nickel transport system permease component